MHTARACLKCDEMLPARRVSRSTPQKAFFILSSHSLRRPALTCQRAQGHTEKKNPNPNLFDFLAQITAFLFAAHVRLNEYFSN